MNASGEAAAAEEARPGGRSAGVPRPLRVAILGAGLAGRWHLHTARRLGADVVAVVDPDLHRAESLARRAPRARSLPDARSLIDRREADVWHVCTPSEVHVETALRAIEAGAHALVEKPMAPSADQVAEVLAAARDRGVRVCPVHQYPFQRGVQRAAREMASLGEISRYAWTACSAGYEADILSDNVVHPLSVLRALAPEVPLDTGDWSVDHARPRDVAIEGRLGGAYVSIFLAASARPTRTELAIYGSRGTLHLDLFHGFALRLSPAVSRLRKLSQPFAIAGGTGIAAAGNLARRTLRWEPAYPGLRELVRRFYGSLEGHEPPPIAPEDALAVATARDDLVRRARSGPSAGRSG